MSDDRDGADTAGDGGDIEGTGGHGGQTALAMEPVTRPLRPTGKRSRQRAETAGEDTTQAETSAEDKEEVAEDESATPTKTKAKKAKKTTKKKTTKGKKAKKRSGPSVNLATPIVYVYTYLKQVIAELRKVIWPNRKQMVTYTSVVLVFLAFMVALIGLADLGLAKLVVWLFG